MRHASVGMSKLAQPLTGQWTANGFPDAVSINGRAFKRSVEWAFPYSGVVAQYREDVDHDSQHLLVHQDGTWSIDHTDDANPERGLVLEHAVRDVSQTPLGAFIVIGLAVAISAGIAAALTRRPRPTPYA